MNKIDELKKLKGLLDNGFVTQEEFNSLKNEILGIKTPEKQPNLKPKISSNEKDKALANENKEVISSKNLKNSKESPKQEAKKEIKLKCKKCSKEISKYLDKSNKGLCVECNENSFQIPKWAYLFLLLIPLAWYIFKDTPKEEKLKEQPKNTIIKKSSTTNTKENNNESSLPKFGYIKGTDIIIRKAPNSSSNILGSFKKSGEKVSILDQFLDKNESQVLLNRDFSIQIDGKKVLIEKGKALEIITNNNAGIYIVQYEDAKSNNYRRLKVPLDHLDFSNNKWFKIKRASGSIGWVFGKFISFDKAPIDKPTAIEETEFKTDSSLNDKLSFDVSKHSTSDAVIIEQVRKIKYYFNELKITNEELDRLFLSFSEKEKLFIDKYLPLKERSNIALYRANELMSLQSTDMTLYEKKSKELYKIIDNLSKERSDIQMEFFNSNRYIVKSNSLKTYLSNNKSKFDIYVDLIKHYELILYIDSNDKIAKQQISKINELSGLGTEYLEYKY